MKSLNYIQGAEEREREPQIGLSQRFCAQDFLCLQPGSGLFPHPSRPRSVSPTGKTLGQPSFTLTDLPLFLKPARSTVVCAPQWGSSLAGAGVGATRPPRPSHCPHISGFGGLLLERAGWLTILSELTGKSMVPHFIRKE